MTELPFFISRLKKAPDDGAHPSARSLGAASLRDPDSWGIFNNTHTQKKKTPNEFVIQSRETRAPLWRTLDGGINGITRYLYYDALLLLLLDPADCKTRGKVGEGSFGRRHRRRRRSPLLLFN